MESVDLTSNRKCQTCFATPKSWDRMKGGRCVACNQSARLGERDDERRIVAPALASEVSTPAPSSPEPAVLPPAAAGPEPCARCNRHGRVNRNGYFSGYCHRCIQVARSWCKRRDVPPTARNIVERLALAEPFGSARPAPKTLPRPKIVQVDEGRPPRPKIVQVDEGRPGRPVLHYAAPAWVFELRRLVCAPRRIITKREIWHGRTHYELNDGAEGAA